MDAVNENWIGSIPSVQWAPYNYTCISNTMVDRFVDRLLWNSDQIARLTLELVQMQKEMWDLKRQNAEIKAELNARSKQTISSSEQYRTVVNNETCEDMGYEEMCESSGTINCIQKEEIEVPVQNKICNEQLMILSLPNTNNCCGIKLPSVYNNRRKSRSRCGMRRRNTWKRATIKPGYYNNGRMVRLSVIHNFVRRNRNTLQQGNSIYNDEDGMDDDDDDEDDSPSGAGWRSGWPNVRRKNEHP